MTNTLQDYTTKAPSPAQQSQAQGSIKAQI